MNKTLSTLLIATAAAFVSVVASMPASADGRTSALELDRRANPDVTVEQRYQAALEQAAETLKNNVARCDRMQSGDRAECKREAHDLYDTDMAKAADILHRPR
jgi:hypothetical protein